MIAIESYSFPEYQPLYILLPLLLELCYLQVVNFTIPSCDFYDIQTVAYFF